MVTKSRFLQIIMPSSHLAFGKLSRKEAEQVTPQTMPSFSREFYFVSRLIKATVNIFKVTQQLGKKIYILH